MEEYGLDVELNAKAFPKKAKTIWNVGAWCMVMGAVVLGIGLIVYLFALAGNGTGAWTASIIAYVMMGLGGTAVTVGFVLYALGLHLFGLANIAMAIRKQD